MKTEKKNDNVETVQITAPKIHTAEFRIVGTAPYIQLRFSQKAIETITRHKSKSEVVTETEERGAYVSLDEVMNSQNYRNQLLAQCKIDIGAFRRKYSALTEVASIIAAMDDTELDM